MGPTGGSSKRGLKALASVGSLARWPFLPLLPQFRALPRPLGPERAAFSGPPPPGTTQALAVGLCGTKVVLSAVAWDTCVVHTQALMASKACLSQPGFPAPVLGGPASASTAQRLSRCSPPSLQLGRPGASGVCLCYLPSHIRGCSCRGLIPLGTGTIQSGPPPSCSVMSWSAWQVQLGRRPHGSSRDRALPSRGRRWDWTEMPAPAESVLSKPQSSPTVLLVLLDPFLPQACFFSPQRHRVALRRGRHEKSEGRATAWSGREGRGLQRN